LLCLSMIKHYSELAKFNIRSLAERETEFDSTETVKEFEDLRNQILEKNEGRFPLIGCAEVEDELEAGDFGAAEDEEKKETKETDKADDNEEAPKETNPMEENDDTEEMQPQKKKQKTEDEKTDDQTAEIKQNDNEDQEEIDENDISLL